MSAEDAEDTALARYVRPRVDPARLARQYAAVEAGLERKPFGLYFGAIFAAAAVSAAAWLIVARPWIAPKAPTLTEGALIEGGGAVGPVTLPEGSSIAAGPRAIIRLARMRNDDVRLELQQGAVHVRATHDTARSFVVVAAGYEVRVVGTEFDVRMNEGTPATVTVHVDEGVVRVVNGPREVATVRAGSTWENAPRVEQAPADAAGVPSASAVVVPSAEPPEPSSRGAVVAPETAKDLLQRATAARAAGRAGEAAQLLDTIRRKHRRDSRAGLAAFELGRLRLDALGDAAGAEEALRDAILLGPTAPFREDAEARRVEALDRLRSDACAAARDAFLLRYPAGIHAATVQRRCAAR